MSAEKRLVAMLDELGRVSDEDGKLTRTFLSPAMRRANALVGGWMREVGLAVREDAVGNLIGCVEGTKAGAKTLLLAQTGCKVTFGLALGSAVLARRERAFTHEACGLRGQCDS